MKKILCKIFGHRFYGLSEITRSSDVSEDVMLRCERCGQWFIEEEAIKIGKWI